MRLLTLFLLAVLCGAVWAEGHPPIPVSFTLATPGYVTLVIDDAAGHRVRNLLGETYFAAGAHTVYWDGLDESGVVRGASTWTYEVQGKLVSAGAYRVHGLVHGPLNLVYELTVNNPGTPPWETEKGDGAWLADHSPQTSVLALPKSPYGDTPQILMAAPVAEAGFSLAWLDLTGKKLYGSKASGWQGGHALAVDTGTTPRAETYAYTLFYDQSKVQLLGLMNDGKCVTLATYPTPTPYNRADTYRLSVAVYNGVAVASLPPEGKLLFIDVTGAKGKILGTAELPDPAGVLVDAAGTLYAVTGKEIHSFTVDWKTGTLGGAKTLVTGLLDPHKLARDAQGNLYVGDWATSNQVKVFSPTGAFLRAIGDAGPLQVGVYNPRLMTQPNGLTIAADGKLWVAESSYLPKRCSVWSLDGKLRNSFIGPTPYGGGGILDPVDKSRFYFAPASGSLEFHVDWEQGTSDLAAVLFRPDTGRLQILNKDGVNQTPHYAVYANGRRYMTNAYNENDGPSTAGIWKIDQGAARLVAAVGIIRSWSVLDDAVVPSGYMKAHLPDGVVENDITIKDPKDNTVKKIPLFNAPGPDGKRVRVNLMFAWSDANGDEQVQPEEVTFAVTGHPFPSWTAGQGLSVVSNFGDLLTPTGFTPAGVPLYDAGKVTHLLKTPVTIGEIPTRQAVLGKDDWFVLTGGPIEGFHHGEKIWYYHSQWASGHSKGLSPKPQYPGQLLNTMALLGPAVAPRGTDTEVWGISGDYGDLFLLTTDGLFVSTLFQDTRVAASHYWPTPAKRGMLLNDCTLLAECYFPTMAQTADGNIYLQAGKNRSSLVRVDGLDTIRRLPPTELTVTPALLAAAQAYFLAQEAARPRTPEEDTLTVPLTTDAPVVDGVLTDWKGAAWATVDAQTKASVRISGDRLYAAFRTTYPLTLDNRPDSAQTIFKGGDALDLYIGTNPAADAKRQTPVPGDIRLTVALVKGKPLAVLFRAVDPTSNAPVKYDSPVGTTTIDRVEEISAQVELAGTQPAARSNAKLYTWELSVPLAALGLAPQAGQTLRADIGILRGNPGLTGERIYWHNKAAGQTADLPTEARLTPGMWGQWKLVAGR